MLLLGVLAAQAEAAAPAGGAAYDLLETEILTGTQASVTFSSLNSTYGADYQHLQLRMVTRSDRSFNTDGILLQINSDGGSNYSYHELYGFSSSVASIAGTSQTSMRLGQTADANNGTNVFGSQIIDILDPFETSKYTTARALGGHNGSSYQFISLDSSLWMNTNAVDTIAISPQTGTNWVIGSRFSLYGLKASA